MARNNNAGDRVYRHTAPEINTRIFLKTQATIRYYREYPEGIPRRLSELDAEWDVERALEAVSSGLSLLGIAASLRRGPKWLLLPVVVQGFFLQHAVQGWCPPLPLLRRAGFRTAQEIEAERHTLLQILDDAPSHRDNLLRNSPRHSRVVEPKPVAHSPGGSAES